MTDLFKNCIAVEIDNGIYYPVRFSPKQFAFYKSYSDFVFIRSLCTADVVMEFTTPSEVISFSCATDNFIRKFCAFDIYENDEFKETFHFKSAPENIDIAYVKKEKGISKITICLPYSCRAGICSLNAEILPSNEPPKKKLKILAYGDSVTQGMFSDYPSCTYTSLIARYFNADLLNQGVGGMPFHKGLLDPNLNYTPDIIIVAYGTIDITEIETYDEMICNAREFIRELKRISGTSKIYISSTIDSPMLKIRTAEAPYRLDWYPGLANAVKEMCEALDINFIDGKYLIPSDPDFYSELIRNQSNLSRQNHQKTLASRFLTPLCLDRFSLNSLYIKDGHPNTQGFFAYALNMIRYIEP